MNHVMLWISKFRSHHWTVWVSSLGNKNTFICCQKPKAYFCHNCFLKSLFGLKTARGTQFLLRKIGQVPLYLYWSCRIIRF